MNELLTAIALAVAIYNAFNIRRLRAEQRSNAMKLSEQLAEMREEMSALTAKVGNISSVVGTIASRSAARISALEEKLAAAGEVDPDLSSDIEKLRALNSQLDAIAAGSEVSVSDVANAEAAAEGEVSPGGNMPNVGVVIDDESDDESAEASGVITGDVADESEGDDSTDSVPSAEPPLTFVDGGENFTAVSESDDEGK